MKKKMILPLLLAALLLCGCTAKQAALPKAADLVKVIADSQTFTEELEAVDAELLADLMDIEEGEYTEAAMLMDASMATAEMAAVLTSKDAKAAEALAEKLKDYLESLKEQYEDYRPEEMPKLNAAEVLRNGNQCVLVVAPDQQTARQAVNKAWGK